MLQCLVCLSVTGAGASSALPLHCPPSSCWCRDSYADAEVSLNADVLYRTAFNRVTQQNQTLYLDEYAAPSRAPRPGFLIIHGGGYSAGPYNGCSHAKNMSAFAAVAHSMARRGFAVVSIDYRCEGALRNKAAGGDYFDPWHDAVEDGRAAVRYMVANAARLRLDPARIAAFGGSAGAETVALLTHALPDGTPMPPPAPAPAPPPPSSRNCTRALLASCPPPFANSTDCLACTRSLTPRSTCKPKERTAYCNATSSSSSSSSSSSPSAATTGGNVTCGIVLSGAILPEAIAAGQVTASAASVPYADFHGTNDTTVPYRHGPAPGSNRTWGDALDTKAWLDASGAPNKLVPIPGAGHVPFGAIPPCDPAGKGHSSGCFNTSFFGFLLGALELDGVACPAKPRAAGLKNIIGS